mmetsp:Transcript_25066/g.36825  ORF Transcript_25066/g.36825 Transcript_25066/m.36825 type:complete len:333 (+) Transcript_25066:8-1006(+)|eukprot:CAMPEP_0195530152 /NCGR_PEP_ID=MMETSP0794_2-20130614/32946_1 /TAXON_ID=515487 /ORGANISM="Stephanopyxis turris, Strain CCMP 815" /LENGTH=332 /DNA_ID=CAMNT_0040661589 /DNA_START=8 /DNA_END=1006 /DNA_ORIENTATION=-
MTRPSIGSVSLFGLGSVATATLVHDLLTRPSSAPDRPKMVTDAIENNTPIYYFGLGSNLSRTKLESRAVCGKQIKILSMEPSYIPSHRLAFNMKGIPPLEPSMGSLEPLYPEETVEPAEEASGGPQLTRKNSLPMLSYDKQECHGALIQLSAEDYQKVYTSEGGGQGRRQGYEEIVVTVVPYDESHPPVKAVAFRAREFIRLEKDAAPSLRYMKILREGAKELGLKPCYQKFLEDHPVMKNSNVMTRIASYNLLFTFTVIYGMNLTGLLGLQNSLLMRAYVPPTQKSIVRHTISEILSGVILLPGSIVGFWMRIMMELTGTMHPRIEALIDR